MKHGKWILVLWIAAILLLLIEKEQYRAAVPGEMIRLHVLAHSDEADDQDLKNDVRDRLLLEFGEVFGRAASMEEAKAVIIDRLSEIEAVAGDEIERRGFDYAVHAQWGIFDFPTRAYGDNVYPAGRYEALRIVIGQGYGANWWCVMFPPLCFVDISSGVARKQDIDRAVVEQAEGLPAAAAEGNGFIAVEAGEDAEVQYTFKLAEWWQELQPKLIRLFRTA